MVNSVSSQTHQEPKGPCNPCPVFLGALQTYPQPRTPRQFPRAVSLYSSDAAAGPVSCSPQPCPAPWWTQVPASPHPIPREVPDARGGAAPVPPSAALLDLATSKFNTSPKPLPFLLPSAQTQAWHKQLMGTRPRLAGCVNGSISNAAKHRH